MLVLAGMELKPSIEDNRSKNVQGHVEHTMGFPGYISINGGGRAVKQKTGLKCKRQRVLFNSTQDCVVRYIRRCSGSRMMFNLA